jgi:hypothetical protein
MMRSTSGDDSESPPTKEETMVVRSDWDVRSVPVMLLTTLVAVGLAVFLAVVAETDGAVAIAAAAGYFAVVQGLLRALEVSATGRAKIS